jgi:hypothetical protein
LRWHVQPIVPNANSICVENRDVIREYRRARRQSPGRHFNLR